MMSSWKAEWIASIVSLVIGFGLRSTSAFSHQVAPLPGRSNALSLALYVKSSIGEAYFVAVPSSTRVIQSSVTAADVVDPSRHVVFKANLAQSGSFPVRASERSVYVIEGLGSGEAYDIFFVIEAANSNGLFSPVNRVLGISTNGAAPPISGLSIAPVDARTNAMQMSFSMDDPGVACRLWYMVLPLRDTGLLEVDQMSAREVSEAARPDGVIHLPQGLKGEHSPGTVIEGLESDTWYQVSVVSERAAGVFSGPAFAVVKTHREPARLIDLTAAPVRGSTSSLCLRFRLDCSVVSTSETCGKSSYRVMETSSRGSPRHIKPRQVAQGDVSVLDGQEVQHDILGLSPGKTYNITMAVETPGSNGAYGPSSEALATTFPDAPILGLIEIFRSDEEPSTVIVHFRLSSPGIIHISLSERLGHPLAMRDAIVGNQHGVSFSREVGLGDSGGDDDDITPVLEGSQEFNGLTAGSAFDVAARTEATSRGHQSGVYGVTTMRVVEAVPPSLTRVWLGPLDATTSELVLYYQVRGTAGRMYYALSEAEATAKFGKEPFMKSVEAIKSATKGQGGVVTVGSILVSPDESEGGKDGHGEDLGFKQMKFQELRPAGRYVASLFTESNSGSISSVLVAEAETHAEAPLVTEVTAVPVDGSAEALSLSISLESSGLVHLVVRRAGINTLPGREHTVVYKGLHEANATSPASNQRPSGGKGPRAGQVTVVEMVEGLEPNSTYEIFIVTESTDSNGVFWAKPEPVIAITHPMPSGFRDIYARAADASSSAMVVTVSLTAPAEVHYALFTTTSGRGLPSGKLESKKLLSGFRGPGEKDNEVLEKENRNRGCANATLSRRGAAALNDTAELVASGIVHYAPRAFLSPGKAEEAPPVASFAASNFLPSSWKVQDLEVMFRIERLEAAKSYDVCLFTETPGSSGLFGDVYELQDVSTHAPVPELVSERVACTLDCRQLNRDSCWLEANKCGECLEGFIGKAGHANSLCGKPHGRRPDKPSLAPRNLQGESGGSQLLLGVPVAMGDNTTKFLYVDVPEGGGSASARARFNPQTAAADICADLRRDGNEPHVCVTSVTNALTSRFSNGRFHAEGDKERPVLQVEVETPKGEWLAFILRHGEEPGPAAVAFCGKNRHELPDEQACVITLKRETNR